MKFMQPPKAKRSIFRTKKRGVRLEKHFNCDISQVIHISTRIHPNADFKTNLL